jgi:hypothetical protein
MNTYKRNKKNRDKRSRKKKGGFANLFKKKDPETLLLNQLQKILSDKKVWEPKISLKLLTDDTNLYNFEKNFPKDSDLYFTQLGKLKEKLDSYKEQIGKIIESEEKKYINVVTLCENFKEKIEGANNTINGILLKFIFNMKQNRDDINKLKEINDEDNKQTAFSQLINEVEENPIMGELSDKINNSIQEYNDKSIQLKNNLTKIKEEISKSIDERLIVIDKESKKRRDKEKKENKEKSDKEKQEKLGNKLKGIQEKADEELNKTKQNQEELQIMLKNYPPELTELAEKIKSMKNPEPQKIQQALTAALNLLDVAPTNGLSDAFRKAFTRDNQAQQDAKELEGASDKTILKILYFPSESKSFGTKGKVTKKNTYSDFVIVPQRKATMKTRLLKGFESAENYLAGILKGYKNNVKREPVAIEEIEIQDNSMQNEIAMRRMKNKLTEIDNIGRLIRKLTKITKPQLKAYIEAIISSNPTPYQEISDKIGLEENDMNDLKAIFKFRDEIEKDLNAENYSKVLGQISGGGGDRFDFKNTNYNPNKKKPNKKSSNKDSLFINDGKEVDPDNLSEPKYKKQFLQESIRNQKEYEKFESDKNKEDIAKNRQEGKKQGREELLNEQYIKQLEEAKVKEREEQKASLGINLQNDNIKRITKQLEDKIKQSENEPENESK